MITVRKLKARIGRYHLLANVLPLALFIGLIKTGFHYIGWEPLPSSMMPFLTGILTGIIFFIGFILAGVITDFKESEKIPGEMAASLYSIWREAENCGKEHPELVDGLKKKLAEFFELFKFEFLIKRRDRVFDIVDSFSEEFVLMDHEVDPPLMARLRAEQTMLWKLLARIKVIRDTSFSKSGYLAIRAITILFVFALVLLKTEPFIEGIFFVCMYSFILFSMIVLIQDMDDPFEYTEGEEIVDEIDFAILFYLGDRLRQKKQIAAAGPVSSVESQDPSLFKG